MNWTFGIITDGTQKERVDKIINSIFHMDDVPPKFEVIIIGDKEDIESYHGHIGIKRIRFNESTKKSWITRKKNIITENAKYDNIVYLHDYIAFDPGWYEGWEKFGDDWDMAMNVLECKNGERFRDWCYWDNPAYGDGRHIQEIWTNGPMWCPGEARLAPYDRTDTHYMYVSGSYFVAKKEFMLKYPLDERLSWGEGEDVEHSLRVRNFCNYKMNTRSKAVLLKEKATGLKIAN